MGVYGGILDDLGIPVKEVIAVRGGIPAFEGIARLGGSRLQSGNLLVLLHGFGVIHGGGILSIHKSDRVRWRSPLGVEHQVGRGHLIKGIGGRQAGIGIPAREGIVAVHPALGRRRRPVVGVGGDRRVKLDVLDRFQQIAAMVVVDFEGIAVVIKIVLRHILGAGVAVVIGIPGYFLRTQVAGTGGIGLAIFFRKGIVIIVRILQPVVYRVRIRTSSPLGGIGDAGTAVGEHLLSHDGTLGHIPCILLSIQPAVECTVIPSG